MRDDDHELLRRLGRGTPIGTILAEHGWERTRFDAWWRAQLEQRLAPADGERAAPVGADVDILRDDRGIAHCFATGDDDLFVAYGYAMGRDRLFQLDMQRRKGLGRLAALIGVGGVELDRVAHTMDLPALAKAELERLDDETRRLLDRYAIGVELAAASVSERLPIEYALLGADWEPWTALDSIACVTAWRWQFTGRPHVIAGPELLKRALRDDRLVDLVLAHEREADTSTLPPDAPYPRPPGELDASLPGSESIGPASAVPGSNDWVIAGRRSRSGAPLLASDPHMPYGTTSAFYEVGLHGGSFDVVGAGLAGMPGLIFGRNRKIAFGITNNICSLRDLYQERPVEGEPGSYEWDGAAEPAERRIATIEVRDGDPVELTVEQTRRGPIIDAILPPLARDTGPVSMRWLGAEACDWPAALLRVARAGSVRDATVAVRGWLVPSFGLVLADTGGSIGFKATGRIPLRSEPSRTYRRGWDPSDRWTGLIPDEAMPHAIDPARGWLASANNRPAPDDYPWPLSGTWSEGFRVRRAGRLIEELAPDGAGDRATLARMHLDVLSPRADELLDAVVAQLYGSGGAARGDDGAGARRREALDALRAWDRRATADSAGAAVFEVLFHRWTQAVMAERIADAALADYLADWGTGLATRLLTEDADGWLEPGRRETLLDATFEAALDELTDELGPDVGRWRWGALHRQALRHPLSGRGDLGTLLDKPAREVDGDLATLDNSGFSAARRETLLPGDPGPWEATSGAGYRLEVDLGESPPAAWTITSESHSGLPGSAHYDDQMEAFIDGRTGRLPLDRSDVEAATVERERLVPGGAA